jgi:hypothetical protein
VRLGVFLANVNAEDDWTRGGYNVDNHKQIVTRRSVRLPANVRALDESGRDAT